MKNYNLVNQESYITSASIRELNTFRFANSRLLPQSYKEFVIQYGYGRSCGEYLIFVPLDNHCDSLETRAEFWIRTYQDVFDLPEDEIWFDLKPDVDIEILKCLYPFAKSENGGLLFWNIESGITEMDIYYTNFKGEFIKVAETLYDFFSLMGNKNTVLWGYPLPMIFEPLKLHVD